MEERVPVVTDDDIAARTTRDEVAETAADDHAVAVARSEHIGSCVGGRAREDFQESAVRSIKLCRAIVAYQNIRQIVATREDCVVANATKRDVGALAGSDGVITSKVRGCCV